MSEIPKAPIKRIAKAQGVERIGDDAVEEIRERIEEVTKDLASESKTYSQAGDRKTVQKEDVKFAARSLLG